jgi:hypothetical protein
MTLPRLRVHVIVLAASLAATAASAGPLQRYTLIVGANDGGPDRPRLQYAVTDAERFARVMSELGGVDSGNEVVLRDPPVVALVAALDALAARLAEARRRGAPAGGRTELFFYYSGHADEKGLLLGEDRLSYRSLRDRLDAMQADVRIAVLDACASGAFTRLKGGKSRPPFLVDESAAMRGHAFLTSSAETEAAQESDRIRASYFTHYLVSGFRGAADMSGDGRVTLNEAYQFAFAETLGRTVESKGGAQHPSYDINLSGAGDVVITDVGQTTARLVLGEDLEGRFFIRNAAQALVVELYKPRGRVVEIGVEPGAYDVRVEREKSALQAKTTVADGARVVLGASQFGLASFEPTRRRGNGDLPRFSVAGKNRLTLTSGLWGENGDAARIGGRGFDVFGGGQVARYLREDLAFTVGFTGYGAGNQVDVMGGVAIPVGLQWNPRRGGLETQRFKPFLGGSVMPVTSADSNTDRRTTVGAHVGAGFDFQVAQTFALGLEAGYNAVPGFDNPSGLHDNFHGLELTLRVGWLFGRGRQVP